MEWTDFNGEDFGPGSENNTMTEVVVSDGENEIRISACLVPHSAVQSENGFDVIKMSHTHSVIVAFSDAMVNETIRNSPSPMAGSYAVGVMVGSTLNAIADEAICEFFHDEHE